MSDKIDQLRSRLYGSTKTRSDPMRGRDWFSFIISGLAFLISAASAYTTLIKKTDDIRFELDALPGPTKNPKQAVISLAGGRNLTIVNSGTRTAAITKVSLYADQPPWPGVRPRPCGQLVPTEYEYDLEPFIIGPGEIVVKRLMFKQPSGDDKLSPDGGLLIVPSHVQPSEGFQIAACLFIRLVTPESSALEAKKPLFSYQFTKRPPPFDPDLPFIEPYTQSFETGKLQSLITRDVSIFGWDK